MNVNYFVGIDISKSNFNFALMHQEDILLEGQHGNSPGGILTFIRTIRKIVSGSFEQVVFCMEHTGLYNTLLLKELHTAGATISVEPAVQIKNSIGLQRGKSDCIDARRIVEYAYRFSDKLHIWRPKRSVIIQLQHLSALRDRLVNARKQLSVPIREAEQFLDKQEMNIISKPTETVLDEIEKSIKDVDRQIKQLILSDSKLNSILQRITTIRGIGMVIATELIIRTNEFKDFQNGKQLACHVGVAPFPHSSGTSIRGKTRISHKAHKKLKTLLHLGAMSAIQCPGELKQYYERKISEGKNRMSVINAVRNKLILRVFAIVKNNTTYDENYQYSFA